MGRGSRSKAGSFTRASPQVWSYLRRWVSQLTSSPPVERKACSYSTCCSITCSSALPLSIMIIKDKSHLLYEGTVNILSLLMLALIFLRSYELSWLKLCTKLQMHKPSPMAVLLDSCFSASLTVFLALSALVSYKMCQSRLLLLMV